MPGEIAPTGKHSGPGSSPELRASHADRDRAVDVLRVAAGDGRLTAAELDERLEAALSARTVSELTALTADLPPVSVSAGVAVTEVTSRCGSSRGSVRSSVWGAGWCHGGWSLRWSGAR